MKIALAVVAINSIFAFFVYQHGIGNILVEPHEHHERREITHVNKSPHVPVNETIQEKKGRILPISFGLPEGRFERAKRFRQLNKTRDFAFIIPGVKATYIYKSEETYYDGYAMALYGITMKKAGWDCFRHYEIIASGAMPYFLNIDKLPPNTMHDFPVHIVQNAMQLPGVPTQEQVQRAIATMGANASDALQIDVSLFNRTRYDELMEELVDYSLQYLTWAGKARYVFSMVRKSYPCWTEPRVLFVTMSDCEYMSCTLWGGMYEVLGPDSMSSFFGPKVELFKSLPHPKKSYGGSFSYSNVFDTWNGTNRYSPWRSRGAVDPALQERLDSGFFNTIVLTNGDNMFCGLGKYFSYNIEEKPVLYDYQKKFNPLVIVLDGNDIIGCHGFKIKESNGLHYHFHFIREYKAARRRDNRLPHGWSGCDGSFHEES